MDIRLICHNGSKPYIIGNKDTNHAEQDVGVGHWTGFQLCGTGEALCGIRASIDYSRKF